MFLSKNSFATTIKSNIDLGFIFLLFDGGRKGRVVIYCMKGRGNDIYFVNFIRKKDKRRSNTQFFTK